MKTNRIYTKTHIYYALIVGHNNMHYAYYCHNYNTPIDCLWEIYICGMIVFVGEVGDMW
jgi:hypothetical protein